MRLVILESPCRGNGTAADLERNTRYARACLLDVLSRNESPIASHVLLAMSGALDDADAAQRAQGIAAGLAWGRVAEATVAYVDLGVSSGMQQGIDRAGAEGRPVELRRLGGGWATCA